eukprot:sb/3475092/
MSNTKEEEKIDSSSKRNLLDQLKNSADPSTKQVLDAFFVDGPDTLSPVTPTFLPRTRYSLPCNPCNTRICCESGDGPRRLVTQSPLQPARVARENEAREAERWLRHQPRRSSPGIGKGTLRKEKEEGEYG